MKILLLEDDLPLNRAILGSLELDGHTVEGYTNGQSVLDALAFNYDLYILDINVPDVSGLELCALITNYDEKSNVIIISANTDIDSIKRAYSGGCIDYIKKPFHLEELLLKVNILETDPSQTTINTILNVPLETLSLRERKLLELMVENLDRTVDYATLQQEVYEGEEMTMYALRSLVKRLRHRLIKSTISNVTGSGYRFSML